MACRKRVLLGLDPFIWSKAKKKHTIRGIQLVWLRLQDCPMIGIINQIHIFCGSCFIRFLKYTVPQITNNKTHLFLLYQVKKKKLLTIYKIKSKYMWHKRWKSIWQWTSCFFTATHILPQKNHEKTPASRREWMLHASNWRDNSHPSPHTKLTTSFLLEKEGGVE